MIPRLDGNENVKNNNRFSWQNNNFARASYFFLHFFAVFARLRLEIAQFYFLRGGRKQATTQFYFLSKLECVS